MFSETFIICVWILVLLLAWCPNQCLISEKRWIISKRDELCYIPWMSCKCIPDIDLFFSKTIANNSSSLYSVGNILPFLYVACLVSSFLVSIHACGLLNTVFPWWVWLVDCFIPFSSFSSSLNPDSILIWTTTSTVSATPPGVLPVTHLKD